MPKKMLLLLMAFGACSLVTDLPVVEGDNPPVVPPITEPSDPIDPNTTTFLSKVTGKFVHDYLTINKGLVYTINDEGTLYDVRGRVRRYYRSQVSPTRAIYAHSDKNDDTWFFGVEVLYEAGRTNFYRYEDRGSGWNKAEWVSWSEYTSLRFDLELKDTR